MTAKDIANRLGIAVTAVQWRIHIGKVEGKSCCIPPYTESTIRFISEFGSNSNLGKKLGTRRHSPGRLGQITSTYSKWLLKYFNVTSLDQLDGKETGKLRYRYNKMQPASYEEFVDKCIRNWKTNCDIDIKKPDTFEIWETHKYDPLYREFDSSGVFDDDLKREYEWWSAYTEAFYLKEKRWCAKIAALSVLEMYHFIDRELSLILKDKEVLKYYRVQDGEE